MDLWRCSLSLVTLLFCDSVLVAQDQQLDSSGDRTVSTRGLFDTDWRERNRCAEALISAQDVAVNALVEIAVGGVEKSLPVRGIATARKRLRMNLRVALRDSEVFTASPFSEDYSALAPSLTAETSLRAFSARLPWGTRQLGVWALGKHGDEGVLRDLLKRCLASHIPPEAVEVVVCVWLNRYPSQLDALLPLLANQETLLITAGEIARRRAQDRRWLLEHMREHPRSREALIAFTGHGVELQLEFREALADFYMLASVADVDAGDLSLALRPERGPLPVVVEQGLHDESSTALHRSISLCAWYEKLSDKAFAQLLRLSEHEDEYIAATACFCVCKNLTTATRQRDADPCMRRALVRERGSLLELCSMFALGNCVAADGRGLAKLLNPMFKTTGLGSHAFAVLAARGRAAVLTFADLTKIHASDRRISAFNSVAWYSNNPVAGRVSRNAHNVRDEILRRGEKGFAHLVEEDELPRTWRAFRSTPEDLWPRVRPWLESRDPWQQAAALSAMFGLGLTERYDVVEDLLMKRRIESETKALLPRLLIQGRQGPVEERVRKLLLTLIADENRDVGRAVEAAILSDPLLLTQFASDLFAKGRSQRIRWLNKSVVKKVRESRVLSREVLMTILKLEKHPLKGVVCAQLFEDELAAGPMARYLDGLLAAKRRPDWKALRGQNCSSSKVEDRLFALVDVDGKVSWDAWCVVADLVANRQD